MKKAVIIFLFLIPMVFAANSDESRITDYGVIGKPVCFENGAVEIKVTSWEEGNIFLPKFIKGVGARFWNSTSSIDLKRHWYDKEGYWYHDDYQPMNWATEQGETAIFISDEFLLRDKGNYTIRISGVPITIIDYLPKSIVYEFNFSCPGYKHACYPLDPVIEQCFEGEEFFYAYFSGLGENVYSKINISRDLNFQLNYQTYNDEIGYVRDLPEQHELHRLGGDRYLMKVPLTAINETIKSLRIEVKGCIEGFHNTSDYSSCGKRTATMEKEVVKRIIENETLQQVVLNLTEDVTEEEELVPDIPRDLTKIEKTIMFLFELIPAEEGSLRRFLIDLGK